MLSSTYGYCYVDLYYQHAMRDLNSAGQFMENT